MSPAASSLTFSQGKKYPLSSQAHKTFFRRNFLLHIIIRRDWLYLLDKNIRQARRYPSVNEFVKRKYIFEPLCLDSFLDIKSWYIRLLWKKLKLFCFPLVITKWLMLMNQFLVRFDVLLFTLSSSFSFSVCLDISRFFLYRCSSHVRYKAKSLLYQLCLLLCFYHACLGIKYINSTSGWAHFVILTFISWNDILTFFAKIIGKWMKDLKMFLINF